MFAKLFSQLYRLITSPDIMWKELAPEKESGNENFYRNYFHVATGVIALASFLGAILTGNTFPAALKTVLGEIFIFFFGFYIAAYTIRYLSKRYNIELQSRVCEKYVGYASAAVYLSAIPAALFPALSILRLLALYSFVIAKKGTTHYLGVTEDNEKFAFAASTVIVILPFLLRGLLYVATQ
ncbi:MAG: YIP1 family protein [Dysgonamonadaceae bacterium]|jgi:hypothetical protein|nr:YIP1 family protein [Dysgonamonadaceae bacterium]